MIVLLFAFVAVLIGITIAIAMYVFNQDSADELGLD